MKVSQLINTLQCIDGDARVVMFILPRPGASRPDNPGHEGDIVHVAVTAVDGKDRVAVLCNCVEDSKGNPVYNVEPHFKRFAVDTAGGLLAAEADLREQIACEKAEDLRMALFNESLQRLRAMAEAVNALEDFSNG
jgi:hypothetical protein